MAIWRRRSFLLSPRHRRVVVGRGEEEGATIAAMIVRPSMIAGCISFFLWDDNDDDKTRLWGGRGGRREIAWNVAVSGGAQLLQQRFDNDGPPCLLFGIGVLLLKRGRRRGR